MKKILFFTVILAYSLMMTSCTTNDNPAADPDQQDWPTTRFFSMVMVVTHRWITVLLRT